LKRIISQRKNLFILGLVGFALFLIVAIYYIIPGYDHFLVSTNSSASHIKHAVAFGAISGLSLIVAIINRPKVQA
jgi:threonine/homoserine/homoserine lactone efflux protein